MKSLEGLDAAKSRKGNSLKTMTGDLTYLIFSEGLTLLRDNRLMEASNAFRRAHREVPGDPRYLSYHGLTVGLLDRNFPSAVKLCRAAVQQAPYDPELCVNLCRVYRESGQRMRALDALRAGLGFDKDSRILRMEQKRMGIRRDPAIGFLSRKHPLNKLIGKLTYKARNR